MSMEKLIELITLIGFIAILFIHVYALGDLIYKNFKHRLKNRPNPLWTFVIISIPAIGPLLYFNRKSLIN